MLSRAAGLARAGARLPTSRTRRSRVLRRTLAASAIVHLLLLVLFVLMPRAPAPETAPDEPGIAMEFERPRPKGAASDAPQPHAGQGTEAPEPSRVQSDAPGTPSAAPPTPSPPSTEPSPLAPAPAAPDTPPPPTPPDTPSSAAQPLQQPPVPPPPDVAPGETAPPDAAALPDVPAAEAPIAPVPAPAAPAPPQPPTVTQAPSTQPAGQPSPTPNPSPVQAPAPEAPEADVQVNAGPLAELFNLQPIPVPQPRPPQPQPQPPPPAPRPRAARPEPAFPTPRQWAFTPAAPGGSPARGGSRGLNLSFAPQIHGGGGARSTPDFSAPDAGPDWENELHAWWDRHGYFPREAAEAGEQGTVGLHLVVNHDGRVTAARLTTQSGSVWLDQGALALFRDANLPPLPPQTSKSQIPVDLRIHYILH